MPAEESPDIIANGITFGIQKNIGDFEVTLGWDNIALEVQCRYSSPTSVNLQASIGYRSTTFVLEDFLSDTDISAGVFPLQHGQMSKISLGTNESGVVWDSESRITFMSIPWSTSREDFISYANEKWGMIFNGSANHLVLSGQARYEIFGSDIESMEAHFDTSKEPEQLDSVVYITKPVSVILDYSGLDLTSYPDGQDFINGIISSYGNPDYALIRFSNGDSYSNSVQIPYDELPHIVFDSALYAFDNGIQFGEAELKWNNLQAKLIWEKESVASYQFTARMRYISIELLSYPFLPEDTFPLLDGERRITYLEP